jgi:Collagen triple helix repeat (20 copies)
MFSFADLISKTNRDELAIFFNDADIAMLRKGQSIQGSQGPKGDTGATGPAGAGMVWFGPWNSGTMYLATDGVSLNGSSYIAINSNQNDPPPSANWNIIAQAGVAGVAGANGPQGLPGEDGESGDPGSPGLVGATGATGSAGVAGASGPVGMAVDGEDGIDGIPGAIGPIGATGLAGPPGFAVDGEDGQDGFSMPSVTLLPIIYSDLWNLTVGASVAANSSAVLNRLVLIASGLKLTVGSAGRLRIL